MNASDAYATGETISVICKITRPNPWSRFAEISEGLVRHDLELRVETNGAVRSYGALIMSRDGGNSSVAVRQQMPGRLESRVSQRERRSTGLRLSLSTQSGYVARAGHTGSW